MNRSPLRAFVVAALLAISAASVWAREQAVLVEFRSPCSTVNEHGEYRWTVKTDPAPPPRVVPAARRVTVSDVAAWSGLGGTITKATPRRDRETQFYTLTGRVTVAKVEPDGDIHVELVDHTRTTPRDVVVEIPPGARWCQVRREVFSWSTVRFPFTTRGAKKLTLRRKPIIAVTGKAFYDGTHAGTDKRVNRRNYGGGKSTVWEIHPVMRLTVLRS